VLGVLARANPRFDSHARKFAQAAKTLNYSSTEFVEFLGFSNQELVYSATFVPPRCNLRALLLLLGLFVYYLLAIIPFIGWLVVPLVMLFGFGAELIARKQLYTTARTQGLI
jgi:uncharacterized membrane protein